MDICLIQFYNTEISFTLIEYNRITNAKFGIILDATFFGISNITVYHNICNKVNIGIELFNSNSVVRQNIISTDPNSSAAIVAGTRIGAFDNTYTPLIDSNFIYTITLHEYSSPRYGIYKSVGAKPTIKNNVIILDSLGGIGIQLGYSDSTKIFNNLIYGKGDGIDNLEVQCLLAYNNYIQGEINIGIQGGPNNILKNNVITGAETGIEKWFLYDPPIVKYNNLWNNTVNYSGFTADTTNISVNPMVVNDDSIQGEPDFHLQMFSPLIDRGDPDILDVDGTRSDIGLYGGPFGESYKYLDLPPRKPVNFMAVLDTADILLTWNRNTEADFGHYNIYRDTTEGFIIDSTKLISTQTDTFYIQTVPGEEINLYYKLTAVDSQGNESGPSEEVHVFLTGINNKKQITINNYRLYQNYPNPFNPATRIGYRLKERGYVKLMVYDIKGEMVEVLVNKVQEAGYYEAELNVAQDSSPALASGIYLYRIEVIGEGDIPRFSDMKKMILLK